MNEQQRRDVVLVVDDSPDTLTLINDTLESSGMDVLLALDGKQALMIASRIRPDVILMDGVMPSLDGFEACKMLKADPTLNSIPVIFMTGLNDTHDIVRGLEVGGVDYLVKPVQPVELLARIKVHLRNARVSNTAQAALDHAGQHLMTVNVLGQITWATPQTHTLLSRANADMEWQRTQLAAQLRHWISQSPDSQMQLHLHGLACPVGLRMLGREPNGQCLIRLFDEGSTSLRVNNAALLKQELGLTERESEVLYWIANGKTNREVAEILGMSPRTVNKHLEQVFPKLGVENRTAAAGIALRLLEKELRQMT
ncbi:MULTISPECIES: DNA-binding response regulator [unclassified Limnobacter]|uniref:response regulator transcription factor n=1 Tax=unclassified Limnobacter TaxID=2630203 RepID=UPI0025C329F0|nr:MULTISPECIES: DNA-binding response regulator [unclassified Limnobacter]|tara:strand:- start:23853 stop:24788 length:936 start_codon:yes stop_codon:yes gene_type:complete